MSIETRDCKHREVLAIHVTELSSMPLMTVECVADAVIVADKARKQDLANTIDIYQSR